MIDVMIGGVARVISLGGQNRGDTRGTGQKASMLAELDEISRVQGKK